MRERLRALPPDVRMRAAAGLARQLEQTDWLQPGLRIAGFWSMPFEVPMLITQMAIEKAGATYHLPVLHADQTLRFAPFKAGDSVRINRFGIPEPEQPSELRMASELDLILLPLTAFDRQGHRLGSGGGWYDRTLAQRPATKRVGVAYSEQELPAIATESWDIPLQYVLTERECIACPPQ